MTDEAKTVSKNVIVYLIERLGFPTVLIVAAWWRLLEPAMEKHFADLEARSQREEFQIKISEQQKDLLKAQAEMLSSIKADATETVIRGRETVTLLKQIEERDGM